MTVTVVVGARTGGRQAAAVSRLADSALRAAVVAQIRADPVLRVAVAAQIQVDPVVGGRQVTETGIAAIRVPAGPEAQAAEGVTPTAQEEDTPG